MVSKDISGYVGAFMTRRTSKGLLFICNFAANIYREGRNIAEAWKFSYDLINFKNIGKSSDYLLCIDVLKKAEVKNLQIFLEHFA